MMLSRLREWLDEPLPADTESLPRPGITLSFAQSLDGSLTRVRGVPTALSGDESSTATHLIRSRHQGILAGIGTVLADDPRLTVRPPSGSDPRPVVLDSRLRTPPQSRLLEGDRRALIIHGPSVPAERKDELTGKDAVLMEVPLAHDGLLDIAKALRAVRDAGVTTLMVEGGGTVLASLVRDGLWDRIAVTVVPRWTGGYRLPFDSIPDIRIRSVEWLSAGDDMICLGRRIP